MSAQTMFRHGSAAATRIRSSRRRLCIKASHLTFISPSALSGKSNYTSAGTRTFLSTASPAPSFSTWARFRVPPGAGRVIPLGRLPGRLCERASRSGLTRLRSRPGLLARQNVTNKTTVTQKGPLRGWLQGLRTTPEPQPCRSSSVLM